MNSTLTRTARNGNETLPEHRLKTVEAGLATHQAVLAERDELDRKLRDANAQIADMTVRLDAIQGVINMLESSVTTHRLQRDEAVAKAAFALEALKNVGLIVNSHLYSRSEDQADDQRLDHQSYADTAKE